MKFLAGTNLEDDDKWEQNNFQQSFVTSLKNYCQ